MELAMVPGLLSALVPGLLSTMVPGLTTTMITDLFRQPKRATNRTKEKILGIGSTFFLYTTLTQKQPKNNLARSLQRKGTTTAECQFCCPVNRLVKPVLGSLNLKTTKKKEIRLSPILMVGLLIALNGLLLLRAMTSKKKKQQQTLFMFKDFLRQ